jgi:hypothetical protein
MVLVLLGAAQVVGLGCLFCVRLRASSALRGYFRGAFLCSLVAVGAATLYAVAYGSGWWVSCGTTLSLMSVGGTIDLGQGTSSTW